jgi:hypothetical protein
MHTIKVKSIKSIGIGETYDLKVYPNRNFYLSNGILTHNSGKSLFTIQNASYIDPTVLDDKGTKVLPRICFDAKEFLHAIAHTKSTDTHTKVVIFDEAFRGMSSRSSLSRTNKMVTQALMEARQNNLCVFIVSPSFYMIDFYSAVLRSKALFHVVKIKGSRQRYVRVFGEKKKAILHNIGARKAWGYPLKTKDRFRFFNKYPGGDEFEARYRQKKGDSIKEGIEPEDKVHKWMGQRDALIRVLVELEWSYNRIAERLKQDNVGMSKAMVGVAANKPADVPLND